MLQEPACGDTEEIQKLIKRGSHQYQKPADDVESLTRNGGYPRQIHLGLAEGLSSQNYQMTIQWDISEIYATDSENHKTPK